MYSDEQRAEALGRYVQEGVAATSKALEIPAGTIASWAHRSGMQTVHTQNLESIRAMTEARRTRWDERRANLLDQFGGIAEAAAESVFDLLEDGNTHDAKEAVTVAAIATDKAQLLAGGPTIRIEVDDVNDRLAADVRRLLEERRSLAANAVQVATHSTP